MSIDRLSAHWGLSRTPFTKELAPSMLFASAAHQEAVARIDWIISERALGVVCGEVGAGKTVAPAPRPRRWTRAGTRSSICPTRRSARAGSTPRSSGRSARTPRFHQASLIPQATDLLAAETAERGKTVVLIFDEAHLLSAEQLEELRMLTNSEMDSRATFACLLLGQPTLRRKLRQGVFAALDQRIALRCTIDGMDRKETGAYIAHHIKLAGRSDTLFSDDAVALIHEASRGLPRQVNNLATQSLIAAFATDKSICDESSARPRSPRSQPNDRRAHLPVDQHAGQTRQRASPRASRSPPRRAGPSRPPPTRSTACPARSSRRSRRIPRLTRSRSSPSCWSAAGR